MSLAMLGVLHSLLFLFCGVDASIMLFLGRSNLRCIIGVHNDDKAGNHKSQCSRLVRPGRGRDDKTRMSRLWTKDGATAID